MSMQSKTDYSGSYQPAVSDSFRFLSVSSADPEIKTIIEPLGYSEKKLLEGKKLYESVRNVQNSLNIIQRWRHSEQKRLIEAKNAAFQTIQDLRGRAKTPCPPDGSEVDMEDLPISVFLSRADAVLRVIENSAESANSSATRAGTELDEATSAFRAWFGQYLAMIMVALHGKKKLLDKLGLGAPPRHIDEDDIFPDIPFNYRSYSGNWVE
jgi:hypothetical protein